MVFMYMKDPTEEFDWVQITVQMALCVAIAVAGSMILGIVPSLVLQYAQQAVKLI
jgi:NADH-quinone oxidoreductase subunit N